MKLAHLLYPPLGLIQTNTGKHLMLILTKGEGQSYVGTFNIVLNTTQAKVNNQTKN